MSGINKKKIILSAGILLLAVIGAMIAFRGGSSKNLAAQLDLGNRYLEDMDYEQAVVAFTKAIQIDPMSVEAHLGLVEAYIRSGEFEEALEAAKKGYELTKDARLKEKVDMIESGSIFDSLGREMKTMFYDQNGDVSAWVTHAYNARGEVLAIAYDRTGKETGRFEGEFDEEGRMINRYGYRVPPDGSGVSFDVSKVYYGENGMEEKVEWNVDADGNAGAGYSQIEYNESVQPNRLDNYDENGKLNGYTLYEYDENWQMTKESYYGLSGEPRGYSTYEYDENGNTIRTEQYDSNGTMTNYNIAEYDESGKLICWKTYDADGNLISESNF